MTNLSKFIRSQSLTKQTKSAHAIDENGFRTSTGVLAPGDDKLILEHYPIMTIEQLRIYISYFEAPRLYEVLGPIELAYRMLQKSFSKIKTHSYGVNIDVAYNPLSILTQIDGQVIRIKTPETELLHTGMEKLALRSRTVEKINDLFNHLFGLNMTFACSCGVGMVKSIDKDNINFYKFLLDRERMGRTYDSDVLSQKGLLFHAHSIGLLTNETYEHAVDVCPSEVQSYLRYFSIVHKIIYQNPYKMQFDQKEVNEFFPQIDQKQMVFA